MKIHGIVRADLYPFRLQKRGLRLTSAEREGGRKSSETVDDAVTGNDSRLRIYVQRIPYLSCRARTACGKRYLSVGRDLALGNLFDDFIHFFKKIHSFYDDVF